MGQSPSTVLKIEQMFLIYSDIAYIIKLGAKKCPVLSTYIKIDVEERNIEWIIIIGHLNMKTQQTLLLM